MLRVVEHIGAELRTMSQRWYTGAGDGPAQAREAMEGFVEVYAEHGPVLRALADAAADDPEVERVYGGLVQSFVDVTARHIEAEMEAGRVLPLDAQETARALVWMMERYLNRSLGRVRSDTPQRDRRRDAHDDLDARALRRRLTELAAAHRLAATPVAASDARAPPAPRGRQRATAREASPRASAASVNAAASSQRAHRRRRCERVDRAGADRHVAGAEARAEHARGRSYSRPRPSQEPQDRLRRQRPARRRSATRP